jgi:hypothetical protein
VLNEDAIPGDPFVLPTEPAPKLPTVIEYAVPIFTDKPVAVR